MNTEHNPTSRRTRHVLRHFAFGASALSFAALGSTLSCGSDSSPTAASLQTNVNEGVGQLRIHLSGSSQNGVPYRLRNATLMVQGPDRTLFFDTEQNPDQDAFFQEVPGGSYSLFLQEGWALENASSGERVTATLLNPNPDRFSVFAGETTGVALQFRVGEDVISTEPGSFQISITVDDDAASPEFCSSDAQCGPGEVCCVSGFLGSCLTLAPGAACPLPDLTMLADEAAASIVINRETFPADSCSLVEGCVNGPGERRLLRFDTVTPNLGEVDLVLGNPEETPGFELSECHGHRHFEGYANYELVDATGAIVAAGHKQAFCLLDSFPVSPDAGPGRFHCEFQGITRGWADVYGAGLDCQWVDITDVPPGDYFLRLTVNQDRVIAESNYDNNTVEVPVTIGVEDTPGGGGPGGGKPGGGPSTACGPGQPSEPCAWSLAPELTGAACTPGEVMRLSCGCDCQGDPILRVCDGSMSCSDSVALGFDDDTCGLCSQVQFTCPDSGVFSALTGTYPSSVGPSSCQLTLSSVSGGGGSSGSGGSSGGGSSGGGSGGGGSGGGGSGGHSHGDIGFDTIHPILVSNCAGCHANGPLPRLANANIETAFSAAQSRAAQIVNLVSSGIMPAGSCDGPPGSDGCVSAADFDLIQQWVSAGAPR